MEWHSQSLWIIPEEKHRIERVTLLVYSLIGRDDKSLKSVLFFGDTFWSCFPKEFYLGN